MQRIGSVFDTTYQRPRQTLPTQLASRDPEKVKEDNEDAVHISFSHRLPQQISPLPAESLPIR